MSFIIVNESNPAWWCFKCEVSHHRLYVDGNKHYCEECVPISVKENVEYECNQNRDVIK